MFVLWGSWRFPLALATALSLAKRTASFFCFPPERNEGRQVKHRPHQTKHQQQCTVPLSSPAYAPDIRS
jgi:hypothetical protein